MLDSLLLHAAGAAVISRLQDDDQWSAAGEKLKLGSLWQAFKDWKTWVGMSVALEILNVVSYSRIAGLFTRACESH